MGGKSFKDILWKIFRFVFLGFMALISVGPLVWIVMSSFKSNKEILSSAFALPTSLSFNGYRLHWIWLQFLSFMETVL